MTRLRGAYSLILALAAGSIACGMPPVDPDTGVDVPVATDQPVIDTPPGSDAGDAPIRRDGDSGPVGDGGALCRMIPIENLNTLGTLTGDTVRLASDNRATTNSSTTGIQPSAALQSSGLCNYRVGHQRVFAYTLRTNSVLRLSTTNTGTDPGFDTTLTVLANMCPNTNQMFLGCNDDDLSFGGADRRVSSTVITARQVMAGATVYIGLGGFVPVMGTRNEMREVGNFVLTVQEIPVVADGMACDRRRQTSACGDTSTCVPTTWPSDTGTCRANGTVAGSACDAAGACLGAGLTCDARSNTCTSAAADGSPCDPFRTCAATSTCVSAALGSTFGTCQPNGSVLTACTAAGTCMPGLTCRPVGTSSFCLRTVAAGGACNTFDSACPTGQSCVQTFPNGTAGTCTADGSVPGAACDTAGACVAGLTCSMVGTGTQCTRTVAAGAACVGSDICDATSTCYLTDLTVTFRGQCFAQGAMNGPCGAMGACPTGQMCSDMMMPENGRCVSMSTATGPCSLTNQCPTGAFCVPTTSSTDFTGMCAMNGSVGTPCNATGAACTAPGANCSSFIPEEGRCQGTATAACDVRYQSNRCGTGQVCRATFMSAGMCGAPTMEVEPNDAPVATLTAATLPAAIQGSMSQFDVDCYALTVPANGQIYARVNTPAGTCLANVNLDLYQESLPGNPRYLGSSQGRGLYGCANIDGSNATNYGWARALPAGRYYACVRDNPAAGTLRAAVPAYVISLNAQ